MTDTTDNAAASLNNAMGLPVANPVVLIAGEEVTVRTIRVKDVSTVLKHIRPIATLLAESTKGGHKAFDVLTAMESSADDVIALVTLLSGIEPAKVAELELDDMIQLTQKVLEVNLDFFIRKVLPLLSGAMGQLKPALQVKNQLQEAVGSTSSSNSSPLVTV